MFTSAFLTTPFVFPQKYPFHSQSKSKSFRIDVNATASNPSPILPPSTSSPPPQSSPIQVGLIPTAGPTGTLCQNLYPIPILRHYSWFLNVYCRTLPSKHGPYTVQVPANAASINLSFSPPPHPPPEDSFPGIPQGNLNIAKRLSSLASSASDYRIRFYDKPTNETFLQRKNHLQLYPIPPPIPPFHDPAPTYTTVAQASAYEVRALYSGGGALPRRVSKFEWFAMGLFPVFPLADYAAFVCVWRQHPNMASVALDKLGTSLSLSWFDPLELPSTADIPPEFARFAVKMFVGPVKDDVVTEQHAMLLAALAASPSYRAVSEVDFRIVMDNSPGVWPGKRKNEIWVQVE